MEREVMWVPWQGHGLEHLRLVARDHGIEADAVIIGIRNGEAFRAHYEIHCDAHWRVRKLRVALLGPSGAGQPEITLLSNGEGSWTTGSGDRIAAIEGCVDVDISVTPFTNTLPIRRLGLKPGGSADLHIAYIDVEAPELRLEPVRQRYTCLETNPSGAFYRFDALPGGFTAKLPIDADGLVTDYPGLFRRIWSK